MVRKILLLVLLIDAKKSFDRVNRDCLWFTLKSLGINDNFYSCIKNFYENVKCAVKVNDHMTD